MKQELKKAIKNSGNNLHLEIVDILETMKWDVGLNSYYCDDITNKPREIDIVAQNDVRVFANSDKYKFKLLLFIECKYFNDELAFRMIRNRREEIKEAIILKMPREIDKETFLKNHHYFQEGYIGKLYDTINKNANDGVFDAITQPVKSLIFFRDHHPRKGLYYPVAVYSGINGLYIMKKKLPKAGNLDDLLDKLETKKNLIFGLNYSYKRRIRTFSQFETQYFCVDFVHKENFGVFVEKIQEEGRELAKYLEPIYRKLE